MGLQTQHSGQAADSSEEGGGCLQVKRMFRILVPRQFGRIFAAHDASLRKDHWGPGDCSAHNRTRTSGVNRWHTGWLILLFCCFCLGLSGCGSANIRTGTTEAVPTLSINATSVGFGNVILNTAATQSVTLTSTGTVPVTVSSATLTGAGFTLPATTLPMTLNPGQALTLVVQFTPAATGAAAGQLTIASDSLTGATAVIRLSGTGAPHEVDLSWIAPSSSDDPIAGYNVYRAPGGTSSFQLLNSSDITETAYVDSAVQSGKGYSYFVTSVDNSGTESVPSDAISVAIP